MILEAIKYSNNFYLRHFFKMVYVCTIPILILSVIPLLHANLDPSSTFIFQGVLQLLSAFFQLVLISVTIMLVNDLHFNRPQSLLNYLFKSVFFIPTLFLTSLTVGLAVLAGFLLILPGIYLLGRFVFIQYVVVLEGKKFFEAFNISQHYARNKAWLYGLTIFFIVFLFIIFLSILTILLSLIFPFPDGDTIPLFIIFLLSTFTYITFQFYFCIFIYRIFLVEKKISD